MPSVYRPLVNFVAKAMQAVLNLALLCLGIILVVFLGKETLHLAHVLFTPEPVSKYKLVEGLVVYFLYFEFIALIVKYFDPVFTFHCAISSISVLPQLCGLLSSIMSRRWRCSFTPRRS